MRMQQSLIFTGLCYIHQVCYTNYTQQHFSWKWFLIFAMKLVQWVKRKVCRSSFCQGHKIRILKMEVPPQKNSGVLTVLEYRFQIPASPSQTWPCRCIVDTWKNKRQHSWHISKKVKNSFIRKWTLVAKHKQKKPTLYINPSLPCLSLHYCQRFQFFLCA